MKLHTMVLNVFIAFTILSPALQAKQETAKGTTTKIEVRKTAPSKNTDGQAGVKVVSIDSVHMLRNSQEGKQLESAIQGEVTEFEELVRKAHNDLNTEKDIITKQASVLSKEALEEKQQKLMSVKKQKELEITDRRETLMSSIQRRQITLRDKQIKVANQLLEEKGWSLIVEKNAPFVLGVAKAIDVTDEVLGAVDQAFNEEASSKEDPKKVEKKA
jgi:Skp family chaperone for outer membrane proteins